VDLKIKPVFRRLITRAAAIIPALVAVLVAGEAALGELLVWSQVILSLVLPFGIIPLVMFVTNPNVVGPENVLGRVAKVFAWIGAALVSGVNVYLIVDFARKLALGEE
jgi:manganese transport protein